MGILRTQTPAARKEYECMFCGGTIAIGEKYNRQTNVYDGQIYDWICHCECQQVAIWLDMYYDCDDGLNDKCFRSYIDEYIYDNHYDETKDDIAKEWQLPYPELVKKILEELNIKNNNETIKNCKL